MEQIRSLSQMIEETKKLCVTKGKKRISVAMAEDAGLISAVEEARKMGLVEATLVGDTPKVRACIAEAGAKEDDYAIIDEKNEARCGIVAVTEVSSKRADIYMKGQLHTDHFLRGMLNKEAGLRSGKVISHCYFHEVEGYDRILFITDAAFNTYPDLKQKADIVQNTVNFARALGVEKPKVACLAAVEVINPDMACTLDAAALVLMNQRGQIRNCVVDGPLALDNAVSGEAARIKKITSPVAGKAEVLLVPNIDAGNMLAKAVVYFSKNETAGVILGAAAPVILTSRADSPQAKLLSIAASVMIAHHAS
ncbi:MAG: bifunctional enoyl-CoA hydratase/phosphate acetyltransferase [Synergistaceae bacterium]|jgi:phosphate butyryltransferase|nr:bifunctional enoyl-CoA hydratase/phosphate acetyltransferase [Synergistaceae bacterium]